MIADIEFRFLKCHAINKYSVGEYSKLEYRKLVCQNADELNRVYEWTDWQDVPVVEE